MVLCEDGGESKLYVQQVSSSRCYDDRNASYQQTALLGATQFEKVNDQRAITHLNVKKAESKNYS